ncbi:S8 family peptidase [Streptomyces qinzhouensis]|uniref:S8 family serine peptidase n=1 Tax=Streptomyces qinzhouensis TaxID=2599401 RepID=A0A5B8JFF4_9ACTN|nr:S8 family serine peptidase [Streptomyces qinzhouensis]QDY79014.1 S8 family serine peptidase [Streptomyces qinzhouensis]
MRQRRHTQKPPAAASALAATLAVALAAGLAGPAHAAGPDGEKAGSGIVTGPAAAPGGKAVHTVTLITGDRVLVDAKGKVTGVERAKGREGIPFRTETFNGRTQVIPRDAERLIATGKVDRRLFDITELTRPEALREYRDGVRAIVTYQGASATAAKKDVRGSKGVASRLALPAANADAVTVSAKEGPALWEALTRPSGRGARSVEPGIAKVWLDAVVKTTLDKSTGQIGAPAAWNRSLDGTGVKIAVLDTGIDKTHPDLVGKVVAEQNFTPEADAGDRNGHGTHVASTAAGTGAKSGGTHKGVAPGAQLLNGKVLDEWGSGLNSEIMTGIDWAVAQGADVINMSLSGYDSPGIDPMEALVNRYTAEKGVLFAVAASNSGPDQGTIGSPGSAAGALTVGAVDDNDKLADFSSRGPEADGGLKPDVTAPGVATTAAAAPGSRLATRYGENPPGYMSLNGTSMATPHAAGAAAILKQKNPSWTGDRIKAVLMASAEAGPYAPHEQGTGRIAVERALDQTLTAEPGSLGFGTQLWPHHDNAPVAKQITYRNAGTAAMTLDLAVTGTDPSGKPAPAGFFALAAQQLTVPAGGTATVGLTADTKVEGGGDGRYSAMVTATGGGQSVRTPATVEREIESYDVTINAIARDGSAGTNAYANFRGYDGIGKGTGTGLLLPTGTGKLRIPAGRYFMEAGRGSESIQEEDFIWQPQVIVDKPLTLTLDTRKTEPVEFTVPDAAATPRDAVMTHAMAGPVPFSMTSLRSNFTGVRTLQIGASDHQLSQYWSGAWRSGADLYQVLDGGPVDRLATGYIKKYTRDNLSLVTIRSGVSVPGKHSAVQARGYLPGLPVFGSLTNPSRPASAGHRIWVSTDNGAVWDFSHRQSPAGQFSYEAEHRLAEFRRFTPGKPHFLTFNAGAQGPSLGAGDGVFRDGNELWGRVPLLTDGAGNPGIPWAGNIVTTLHRDGVLVARSGDPLTGRERFTVPDGEASYTLATTVERPAAVAAASTKIAGSWTFRSDRTASATALPVSTVAFAASAGIDSTAPAGESQTFPLVVKGAAAGKHGKKGQNLKSLTAEVSYDEGRTWKALAIKQTPVVQGGKVAFTIPRVTVTNPAAGKGISFRATVVDRQGNKGTVTVVNAYLGK